MQPLKGINVVDFSNALAVPFATTILADQGAHVIKVEPPIGGDILRYIGYSRKSVGGIFQMANRGKRSIALDIRKPEGLELALKLISTADVVTHNFRPGVVERLGIDYETVKKINKNIVYLSITGYGDVGPRANMRAYDNIIQAFSGAAHLQANEKGEPAQVHHAIADKLTSMTSAQAITAALFAMARGLGGQHIKLSMLDSVLSFIWVDGSETTIFLEDGPYDGSPVAKNVKLVRFSDGWGNIAPVSNDEFFGLCRAFNVKADDPRIATPYDRMVNNEATVETLAQVYERAAQVTTAEAMKLMEQEDVPCAPALSFEELIDHPQLKATGTFVELKHHTAGGIIMPKPPAQFCAQRSEIDSLAPDHGEHTQEIINELGMSHNFDSLLADNIIAVPSNN